MRIGLVLPPGEETIWAPAAEARGLFGVLASGPPGADVIAAGYAAAATNFVRVGVRLHLGELPVTLAEEVAVLDNASGGRIVVVVDGGSLSSDDVAEDVGLLRRALTPTPLRHVGARWVVPAGLPGQVAPDHLMVTPSPAQVEVPVWAIGETAEAAEVPVVRTVLPGSAHGPSAVVRPGLVRLAGAVEADRATVVAWAAAGTTHLFVELAPGAGLDALDDVARYLVPEVGMVGFPQLLATTPPPMAWPG